MSKERFNALGMWCRSPGSLDTLQDCAYFSADNERLIGATYYARPADAFAFVLLARDAHGRFQGFANQGVYVTARAAEAGIRETLARLTAEPTPEVPMRPGTRPGVNLFTPIPNAALSRKFINLCESRNASAARELLAEVGRWVVDLDGNLVRDFQTTGFDGRIWELYLFAALTELGFGFDRTDAVPDFRLKKGDTRIFIEAVTANPTGNVELPIDGPPPPRPENYWSYMENEMPQKFGSPLLSKMRKKYWERPDVAGHPFLIALADFHAPASMVWSNVALSQYLYGVGVKVDRRDDGTIVGVEKPLDDHVVGRKVVPTNFFGQPENRHVSAILACNAGTLTKFNRMGARAGFGDPSVVLTRSGILNDPTPGSFEGTPFEMNVENPDYSEGWADEIEIYHNPNAATPLAPEFFNRVTQFFLEDGEVVWRGPSPRVLTSATVSKAFPAGRLEPK